ncbi:hypothetical protein Q5Y75_04700 [Ruegeria sp. 2205SS24-7]|uniref:hypothetical protein n=1 Tax=Ruegeria discodermiae TaxID=3064389 RepID=UPI002740F430|nr:hypothetical protein [Ruegeria sp. 2205SS24-7]MDP5216507.1 hypothetical protein [Ruegeria sp. 2205SS24-7]
MNTGKREYLWTVAPLALGALLAIPVFLAGLVDDAYIHARIVEALVQTGQPTFNLGDTFKASSSTGYIFLLAAMGTVFDTIFAMRLVEAAVIVSVFVLGAQLVRQLEAHQAFAAFALLSGVPFVLLAAYGGMETPIFVALMLGTALALRQDRFGLAVFLVAVAVWFRIETLLLLLLLLVWVLRQGQRIAVLWNAWPILVLFAIEFVLYGSILPHAAGAKSLAYGHSYEASAKLALRFGTGKLWAGILLFGLLIARLVGVLKSRDFNGYADVFFAFSGGVLCAWMIGRSNLFTWYYPLVFIPFAIGLATMPSAGRVFRGVALLVLATYLVLGGRTLLNGLGVTDTTANFRVAKYLDIGRTLYTACPDCSLVTSEIGGLGYGFRGRVYDGFGLADPEALQFHPMSVPKQRASAFIGAIPPEYIKFRNPDFVVSMPVFTAAARESGVLGGYTKHHCPFSADGSISIFGDEGIDIFSKQPLPALTITQLNCSGDSPT